jgi:hypothetical protein
MSADDHTIRSRAPKHRRSLLGILGGPDILRLDEQAFREAVERAWDEAAREACDASTHR